LRGKAVLAGTPIVHFIYFCSAGSALKPTLPANSDFPEARFWAISGWSMTRPECGNVKPNATSSLYVAVSNACRLLS